jgi:hypothetical protein
VAGWPSKGPTESSPTRAPLGSALRGLMPLESPAAPERCSLEDLIGRDVYYGSVVSEAVRAAAWTSTSSAVGCWSGGGCLAGLPGRSRCWFATSASTRRCPRYLIGAIVGSRHRRPPSTEVVEAQSGCLEAITMGQPANVGR